MRECRSGKIPANSHLRPPTFLNQVVNKMDSRSHSRAIPVQTDKVTCQIHTFIYFERASSADVYKCLHGNPSAMQNLEADG
jgi:hypothetical protein